MNLDKRIEEGIQKLLRQKKAIAKRGEDTKAIDKKIKDKAKEGRTRARKRAGGGNKPGSIAHGTEQALKPGTSRSGSWPAGANRPKGSTQWQRESTLKEGIRRTLRKSIAAIKASTKEVPGYKPGGSMGKNPHAAELRKQIKQGRERAAKNKRPATGTETALKNALEKLKKKPRIEDYMSKKERENLLRLQGGENSSTEYEGPSLSEQLEFIKTFLDEGKFTRAIAGGLLGAALCTGPGCSADKPAPEKPSVEKKVQNKGSSLSRARAINKAANPLRNISIPPAPSVYKKK